MTFQPDVGQELEIDKIIYRVAEHPAAPGMPYGQEGRQAVVYKLLCEEGDKAFKVFKSRFRTPAMVTHADQIEQYSTMQGLHVCRRTVLTSRRHTELLRQYPDLTYAVLMPWVEGPTWQEIILEKRELTPQQSLLIARTLAEVLVSMEERGIAHCDLSGANLILNPDLRSTELVDVEGIYSSDLPRPKILPAGSPGYAHETAPKGLWDPDADRFAGAVLLSEALGWCDEVGREKAWGESYFNPRLIQQDNESYTLFFNSLQRQWGKEVSQLFARAWNSDTLAECPTFGEWWVALPTEVPEIGVREKAVVRPVAVEEELEPEPEPEPLAPEPELLCPHCGNRVPGGMDTCPHCEKDIDWVALDRGVLEPKRKRKVPVWAWVGIGILTIGLALIGLVIGGGGAGMLSWLTTETPTSTSPPIHTNTSTPTNTPTPASTPIPTNTPTPTPDPYVIRAENIEYVKELVRFDFPDRGNHRNIAWSPKGDLLAVGDCYSYEYRLSGSSSAFNICIQGGITIWNMAFKSEVVRLFGPREYVSKLIWSPDGTRLASFWGSFGNPNRVFILWNTITWEQIVEQEFRSMISYASWSPDGTLLATSHGRNEDISISIWETNNGTQRFKFKGHSGNISEAVWSPDGTMLASGGYYNGDESVRIWDVVSGEELFILEVDGDGVYSVDWSPTGKFIASGNRDGSVIVWDAESGEKQYILKGHKGIVSDLVWSPDGTILASSGDKYSSSTLRIWDANTGAEIHVLGGRKKVSYWKIISWSPDGSIIVDFNINESNALSYAGEVHIWDVKSGENLYNSTIHFGGCSWSPDGELLAIGGTWPNEVSIWDRNSKNIVKTFDPNEDFISSIYWSPDGKYIAVTGYHEVSIWGIPEP